MDAMFDGEPYSQWEARFLAWLASLPPDHPVLKMDEIDQCVAFDKATTKSEE